jgi:hypothetical protein
MVIRDLVSADMKTRDAVGTERYNTRLRPFNGRSYLRDAYEECLDQAVYLRGAIYEQEHMLRTLKEKVVAAYADETTSLEDRLVYFKVKVWIDELLAGG